MSYFIRRAFEDFETIISKFTEVKNNIGILEFLSNIISYVLGARQ